MNINQLGTTDLSARPCEMLRRFWVACDGPASIMGKDAMFLIIYWVIVMKSVKPVVQFSSQSSISIFLPRHYLLYNVLSGLWIMAAKWEFEENKNIPNSRSLLQRGLRVNSSSQQLWLEVR